MLREDGDTEILAVAKMSTRFKLKSTTRTFFYYASKFWNSMEEYKLKVSEIKQGSIVLAHRSVNTHLGAEAVTRLLAQWWPTK